MTDIVTALVLFSILGSGIIGGTFFAFSTFFMEALDERPAEEAVPAMKAINIVVVRSLFIAVFLGTAVICVALVVLLGIKGITVQDAFVLGGSLSYLIGCFLVTVVFNVPKNNSLAKVDEEAADLASAWKNYAGPWTKWNHVRTAASLIAAMLFTFSLLYR